MTQYIVIQGFFGYGINGTGPVKIKVTEIVDSVTSEDAKPFDPTDVVKIRGKFCWSRESSPEMDIIVPRDKILYTYKE